MAPIQWMLTNKRLSLIVILLMYAFFQTWQANHLAGEVIASKQEIKRTLKQHTTEIENLTLLCSAQKQEIVQGYQASEQQILDQVSKLSQALDQAQKQHKTKVENIHHEATQIIAEYDYSGQCFTVAGLQLINSIGTGK